MNQSIKDTPEHKEFWRIIDADRDMTTMVNTQTRIDFLLNQIENTTRLIEDLINQRNRRIREVISLEKRLKE